MFRKREEIRDAYRDRGVAGAYVADRFREPLGALLHARQVAAVRKHCAAAEPKRVLELAPGPARVTVDVSRHIEGGVVAVDASFEMLTEAKRRLAAELGGVRLVQGDAFQLPFGQVFDFVFSFRLIRHFQDADRTRVYRELQRVIRPGGWLVFDAVNEAESAPLRRANPAEYRHYDALLDRQRLEREVSDAGFALVGLVGVLRRFPLLSKVQVLVAPRSRIVAALAMRVIEATGGEPLEWIVTCRRK